MNDQRSLVQRVIAGNSEAREAFYERYRRLVWHIIMQSGAFAVEADALFQQFFLHLFEDDCLCLRQWRSEHLEGYLGRVLRNLAIDTLRKKQSERRRNVSLVHTDSEDEEAWEAEALLPSAPSPEAELLLKEMQHAVAEALSPLPDRGKEEEPR